MAGGELETSNLPIEVRFLARAHSSETYRKASVEQYFR